jgi:hypothetical protein
MLGGGMIGLQFAELKAHLGPLLNGIVAYDLYAPEPTMTFPGLWKRPLVHGIVAQLDAYGTAAGRGFRGDPLLSPSRQNQQRSLVPRAPWRCA